MREYTLHLLLMRMPFALSLWVIADISRISAIFAIHYTLDFHEEIYAPARYETPWSEGSLSRLSFGGSTTVTITQDRAQSPLNDPEIPV
ncbi:hypothetical protein DL96DRAFT_1636050 [Flagelloscypha sp. PMI_526]|nr:hypothetical protein DL96DRAFT_1636050 [Flagelloscypha sp. PMI_526]